MSIASVTTKELLDLCAILRGQRWTSNWYGEIRNDRGDCPGCALAYAFGADPDESSGHYPWSDFEKLLGRNLDRATEDAITDLTCAADYLDDPNRARLLFALGIEEAPGAR